MSKAYNIYETLHWLKEIGVDEVIDDKPQDAYALAKAQENNTKPTTPKLDEKKSVTMVPPSQSFSATTSPTPPPEALEKVQTLSELRELLQNFEACHLKKTATNLVFGDGEPGAKIMIVGEAPGADEDRQGLPFVGKSGQLLANIFRSIGFERKDLYITNIVPWRPPGNRQPTTNEIALCLPFIQKHVSLVQPKVLLLVGGIATKSLLDCAEGITRLRGKWFEYAACQKTIPALATYHPAFLLRSPSKKKDVWQDMQSLQNKLATI